MDWAASVQAEIDAATVQPLVRRHLASPDARPTAITVRPLEYPNVDPDARLLMRVDGQATEGGGQSPWSIVLKAFRRVDGPAVDDPTHYEYWQREPLFFESGLWADLPPGLRSVRPLAVDRRSPDELWVWLEPLTDEYPDGWPAARFELAAHHLGRFAGGYLAGHPIPTAPWLSATRSIHQQWSVANPEIGEPVLHALETPPTTSSGAPFASASDREALRAAFRRQADLLDAADALPRVVCHNDTLAANLFACRAPDGSSETVAIDWALVGIGPVGADLGQLVAGSATFFRAPVDDLETLDRRCFEAYVSGLEEAAGVVPRDVRLASLTTVLAQWTSIVAWHLVLALDPANDEWVEAFWHRPRSDVVEQFTPLLSFLARRANETVDLLDP